MTLLGLAYPGWGWLCALFVFLVGLSRVYLGVHYPSDVFGGWLLGIAIGWGVWTIVKPFALGQPKPVLVASKTAPRKIKSRRGVRRGRR
jgi:membrane-associated phospholipid phosphatase